MVTWVSGVVGDQTMERYYKHSWCGLYVVRCGCRHSGARSIESESANDGRYCRWPPDRARDKINALGASGFHCEGPPSYTQVATHER